MNPIKETFLMAVKSHQKNDLLLAESLYNEVLKYDPNHIDAHNNLGLLLMGLDKIHKAKYYFEKAIKINPKHSHLHNNLGTIFLKLKENQKAIDSFQKAIEITPNNINSYNNLGDTFRELMEYHKAIICYEKVIQLKPDLISAHYNLGIIYQILKEDQKAINCYEEIIKINPNHGKANSNLGTMFKVLDKIHKAKNHFEKAIEINSNDSASQNNLGVVFNELAEYKKARTCFEKAIEIKPNFVNAHLNLASIYVQIGDDTKAEKQYEKVINLDPNHLEAQYKLGLTLHSTQQYKKAAKHLRLIDYKKSKSYLLSCLFNLDEQFAFFKELDNLINNGVTNPIVGSLALRAEIKYGLKKKNLFCKEPLKHVLMTDLKHKCDFKFFFVDAANAILNESQIPTKKQDLLTNGHQTAGNLFDIRSDLINKIKDILLLEIEKYRINFKDSEEGLIKNWPSDYLIQGWLVSMKSGGNLSPHIHDFGWLSGSVYINVPPKLKKDNGNLVLCIEDKKNKENENNNLKKNLDVVTGSMCLFPSSLLHYTIPFESKEDRVVLAFDVIPKT